MIVAISDGFTRIAFRSTFFPQVFRYFPGNFSPSCVLSKLLIYTMRAALMRLILEQCCKYVKDSDLHSYGFRSSFFASCQSFCLPARTPADWPEADALITRQAVSERSELGCPPKTRVRFLQCCQAGRHWFWLLLPEQKWLAYRDETRQNSDHLETKNREQVFCRKVRGEDWGSSPQEKDSRGMWNQKFDTNGIVPIFF